MMFSSHFLEAAGIILIAFNELGIVFSPFLFRLLPGLKKEKVRKLSDVGRVAAVVCAHNEESTIGNLLVNLQGQTRPADVIYVVADNCSDRTAAIAAEMEAVVLEKGPTADGGKADALKFFFEKTRNEHFDGFVFFDADTIPNAVFLEKIIQGLNQAEIAVGYHSFENCSETWSEAGNSMLGHVMWHHYLEPRFEKGYCSLVIGMGYGLRRSYLERMQWIPHTRTEDLALSLDSALTDADLILCPDAQFRDKQPENWCVSWNRMRRWMTGDLQCLGFYFIPLLKQIIRGDLMKADFLSFLLSVPTFILKSFGMLCLAAAACLGNWQGLVLVLVFDFMVASFAILSKRKHLYLQTFSLPALYFLYLQLPWIASSVVFFPAKRWIPGREAPCAADKKVSF